MSKAIYKHRGNIGFFDQESRLEKLLKLGHPLEKLHHVIDFEMFRNDLENFYLLIMRKMIIRNSFLFI